MFVASGRQYQVRGDFTVNSGIRWLFVKQQAYRPEDCGNYSVHRPAIGASPFRPPETAQLIRKTVLSQILGRRRLAVSLSSADSGDQQVSIGFKGSRFERDVILWGVILWGVRWYVAYPISYRQLEEMMEERGVEVDHSTLNPWVLKDAPLFEREFRARKRSVGRSWRMDETDVKVKMVWKYLYRAVDKAGATVDFLLTTKRDHKAVLRFLRKAFDQHGTPELDFAHF
jgi:putative transposase